MKLALALALLASPTWAQDGDEDQLTPGQAMETLKDIHGLMRKAEELLNDSSRGKALETEEELLKRLRDEFKDEPEALQKQVLEKVKKLMERSEKKQKDAIDRMVELIKKARTRQTQSQERQPQRQPQSQPPKNPGERAQSPYDPNRADPPSKFRSQADRTGRWGDLPPRIREAMMHGMQDIDEYPEEFRSVLRKLTKKLAAGEQD